jgi:hypothetical protein
LSAPEATVPGWVYLAPKRAQHHEQQCYYRAQSFGFMQPPGPSRMQDQRVQLFRFADDTAAELQLQTSEASLRLTLDPSALLLLRDALNDALHDIAVVQAEAERRQAFERIQDELRDAGEGGPDVYYAHPDVHYVPADQVQAKVAELEAAGAPRYIVLADPAGTVRIEGAAG